MICHCRSLHSGEGIMSRITIISVDGNTTEVYGFDLQNP